MLPRSLRLAFGFALCGLVAAKTSAAPDPCQRELPLAVDVRFHAGERPTSLPVLTPNGTVYVGTAEGYVHALAPDGTYLWGYTLRGPVVGELALGATATVLVATPRRVYAIRSDGTLLWVFESPIAVRTGLASDGTGRFFFASDDGRLFALSGRGALVAHVDGKVPLSTPPVGLGVEIGVGAGRVDGSAIVTLGFKTRRFELGGVARELFACSGVAFCALVNREVLGVADEGARFRHTALHASAARDRLAVLAKPRVLEVYTAGQRAFSAELSAEASAAPLVDPRGRVFVPLENGALVGFSETGARIGCAKIADSPLETPVFDGARGRVWVTAREGWVSAVEGN